MSKNFSYFNRIQQWLLKDVKQYQFDDLSKNIYEYIKIFCVREKRQFLWTVTNLYEIIV